MFMSRQARANAAKAAEGVVVPVIEARPLGVDVLADVAARYGVQISAGARAVALPRGAAGTVFAPNAQGVLVMVRPRLVVEGDEVAAGGAIGAEAFRAGNRLRRRRVEVPRESKAALRVQALAERNATLLARVLEMVSQGHRREDVRTALGLTESVMKAVTAGADIAWPRVVAKRARVPKAAKAVSAAPTAWMVLRAEQRAARLERVQAMAADGASKTQVARELGMTWMALEKLVAGRGIVFANGLSSQAMQRRRAERAAQKAVELDELRALAAQGLTRAAAAKAAGICVETLRARVRGTDIVFREGRGGKRGVARAGRSETAERDARIVALYRTGMLQRDIAAEVGLAFATISQILRAAGVEGERQRAAMARGAAIAEAVRGGEAPSVVAARFGLSVGRVRAICCKAGVSAAEKRHGPEKLAALRVAAVAAVAAVRARGADFGAITAVAEELGLSRTAVSRWVNAAGVM